MNHTNHKLGLCVERTSLPVTLEYIHDVRGAASLLMRKVLPRDVISTKPATVMLDHQNDDTDFVLWDICGRAI